VQDLGDYLQYLPAEIPSGVPGPTGSPSGLVARFRSLSQPVRDEIRLELELTRPATTSLDLFAFSGRRVGTLLAGEQLAAGTTVHRYDAAGIPSGLYLLRLEAGGERVTRKVLVLH
jgi:hypothetical protein